jgi:hypothetical protein
MIVFKRTTIVCFEFLTSVFWGAFLFLSLNRLQVAVVNGLKWSKMV